MRAILIAQALVGTATSVGIATGVVPISAPTPVQMPPQAPLRGPVPMTAEKTVTCSVWIQPGSSERNPFTGGWLTNEERQNGWVHAPIDYPGCEAKKTDAVFALSRDKNPFTGEWLTNEERQNGWFAPPPKPDPNVPKAGPTLVSTVSAATRNPFDGTFVSNEERQHGAVAPPVGYKGPVGAELEDRIRAQGVRHAGQLSVPHTARLGAFVSYERAARAWITIGDRAGSENLVPQVVERSDQFGTTFVLLAHGFPNYVTAEIFCRSLRPKRVCVPE